jgi:carbon storage regulator CsrA
VLGFKGNQVRIGIEAPPDVTIDREEVWERKQIEVRVRKEGQSAAAVRADVDLVADSVPTLHEQARIP